MAEKCFKRSIILSRQGKAKKDYVEILSRSTQGSKIKRANNNKVTKAGKDVGNQESSCTVVGVRTAATTVETSMELPQGARSRSTT